ncbi:MAG: indole-3-glycerol phosphate synthase / phosphoribosylanthranilate isomerase [Gaiellaceae bacterium]|jgi:indole-3-glycerol phosphate synthase/phosphoribosylanthranilate isomerase/anthranilate synthase/indole-3-glycerol phosphate synthase/phosphoribosylanthranilate isomerase|nr:indole-3-glycerol phosphate synthase / phosphoribosylanthranilate isomerase [Gaiellaceae bacterium]
MSPSYHAGVQRFREAISDSRLSAIAEFKRRSPSMGDIRPDARIEEIVPAYERGGASAVSVLVDERFAGSIDDLRAARAVTTLPLLAKGFFSTEEHLREVREAGADAALLILRDLDDETTTGLINYADELGLEALVEAHDYEELHRAMRLGDGLIGVNARDLSTFEIDREEQLRLVAFNDLADDFVVAESGIHTRVQAVEAELAGAHAVLVGTSLMQASDPETKLRELLRRPLVKVCGLTRQEDVNAAVEAGADMLGFIFAQGSPRQAPAVLHVPDTALSVAVFVGAPEDRGADLVQVYEPEEGKVRGRRGYLASEHGRVQVWDLPWDEPDPDHWVKGRSFMSRGMLAGRLGPDNVRAAIDAVDPWAVDAASRLESEPGIKDHAKVRAYVEAARG